MPRRDEKRKREKTMKHTLREYLEYYKDAKIIYLLTEKSYIRVDIEEKGSFFILKHFLDEKFKLESYCNEDKILELRV